MTIRETWFRLRTRLPGNGLTKKYTGDEPPLRSELFSTVIGAAIMAIDLCGGVQTLALV